MANSKRKRNEELFRKINKTDHKIRGMVLNKITKNIVNEGYYCECSDLGCLEKVQIAPNAFKEVRANDSQYIIKPGHEQLDIEKVVEENENYYVVEKF